MATSPVTPAASAPPNMSNYEAIGAALSDPGPSQAETSEATTAAEPAETTTAPPESEPPAPETGEQAEVPADAAAATPEPENPYEQNPDEDFAPQTLKEILTTPDGRRMYANHKLVKELAKPFEQGGIGHVPTIEEVRNYAGAYRDQVMMDHDLSSGNPQQAERLIAHLFSPQRGEGAQVVAAQIGRTLAKLANELQSSNPAQAQAYQQAYVAAANPFLETYNNALWDRWTEMPGGAPGSEAQRHKEALGYAAQVLEFDLTGKYRDPTGKPAGQAQANPQDDPLAAERANIQAREQRLTQYEQRTQQVEAQRISQGINARIDNELTVELDKALAPLKALYEKTPKRYERDRRDFNQAVVKEIPKNQHAWDILQTHYADAVRSRNPEAIDALVKEYVKLAVPHIQALRKQFLEESGVAFQAQSDARHAELRSIDSKKALTNGGGAGKVPNAGQPIVRRPGESQADFNFRQLTS